jgi:histidinol dehydrogenase
LLVGEVGIDMIAGPAEITILADESAAPEFLAADMLSQAEHDPLAAAICITTSQKLATALHSALDRQLATLPRHELARRSLKDWGAILVADDMEAGIGLVNRLAPEHLELAVADPFALLGKISQRRRHLPGPPLSGARGRLFCRAEPCAAHPGHGALLFGALRAELL